VRILFCGTPDFAALALEALLASLHQVVGVVSQPSRPQGRGLRPEDPPAVVRAREAGVPVFQTQRLHAPSTLEELKALTPELIVTAAFGRILKAPLLNLPPRGCWNVHASLLPRHRGASPVTAALLAGDAWTGVTVFKLDEGVDTGPVLLQEMTPIGPEETAGELTDRLARLGGRLLVEALDLEEQGRLIPRAQPPWGATVSPILTKEDGRIPWDRPADQIHRLVRAVSPWPGAYTFLGGKRLRIHRLRPLHLLEVPDPADPARPAPPGTIVPAAGGIGVACRPGLALLCEVQSEGKRRQEVKEWLRGNRADIGQRLDPAE
jgi:methionyl-tRNA formyltransferase